MHSQPSRSAAGGVALYTSKSLNAVKRTDLSVTDEEFETVWVETKNIKSKSILCCCAYRHPSSSPERFTEHIETILHNLARENKNILILVQISQRLLKLTDVLESQILSFVYQWSRRLLPPCFSEYFKFTSSVHSYSTRQSCNRNLYVTSVNITQYGLRSLKFTGPRLWNYLPTSITNSSSLRIFRKTLKNSILNCYSN